MNKREFVAMGLALLVAGSAQAHHSYAKFDANRIIQLNGTVESYQWTNPHVLLKVLIEEDDGGQAQEWQIETSGPAILRRFGWTGKSLKPGDRVRVICNPLIDGSRGGHLHTLVVLGTGRTLRTKLSGPTG